MTVKEAQEIVRAKYPESITGIVRGTGWIAVKRYPFGSPIGPYASTVGWAWKKCAEKINNQVE